MAIAERDRLIGPCPRREKALVPADFPFDGVVERPVAAGPTKR